jgi:hypothetical protein
MTTKARVNGAFPPTLVSKLLIGKIAFVDAGAGIGVDVLMAKSKMEKAATMEKLIAQITDFLAAASPEMKAAFQAALGAISDGAKPAGDKPAAEAKPAEPVVAAAPEVKKNDVTPEVKKALDEKNAENVELKKRLDAIETEREVERFAKTAAELPYVPGMSATELGEHLRIMSKSLTPAAYDKALAQYRAINAAISQSEILKNVGSPAGSAGGDARSKLSAIANEIMTKQGVPLSKALKMAYEQNRALVAEAAHMHENETSND